MTKYGQQYILAVEGNPPLNEDGMSCIIGGRPFCRAAEGMRPTPRRSSPGASCASWGCVQAAKPNPTRPPIHKVITDKPIIKVPGCPPIAEVMTGVVTYMLTFDRIPRAGPPGPAEDVLQPAHPRQVLPPPALRRRPVRRGTGTTSTRERATASTRSAARARPPTTPARPCSGTGHQLPDRQAGHGCIGCSRTVSGTRARSTTA